MRPYYLACFLAALLFAGCQKEDPDPSDKVTEEPSEQETPKAEINASGGKLSLESIAITIPAGAFQESENLELSELSDSTCFGDNAYSGHFRLEGLPESWDQPLKVRIAYSGELEGETFLIVGEEGLQMETGEADEYYQFLSGRDSSGFLLCEIPGVDNSAVSKSLTTTYGSAADKKWINMQVVSNYFSKRHTYINRSYKIYVPADNSQVFSPAVIDYLDHAYKIIESSILSGGNSTPVETYPVFMARLPDQVYCRFAWKNAPMLEGRMPKGIYAINTKKMNEPEKMKVMVGREVLRSALFSYDPRYPYLRKPDQIPHYWLDQALISWSELYFSGDPAILDKGPSDFKGNELKPFHGMHAGSLEGTGSLAINAATHGKGMTPFIEFLIAAYDDEIFTDLYNKISRGAHPIDAIKEAITLYDDLPKVYFTFLNLYLMGGLYKVPADTFLESIPETRLFSIEDEDDTIEVFQDVFPDLSAKLYRIDLKDPVHKEKGTLEFVVTGGTAKTSSVRIGVFGLKNEEFTYLGNESITYEPKDFASYSSLVVLLFNGTANTPYTGNSTIELSIYADKAINLIFKSCEFQLLIQGEYEVKRVPQGDSNPYNTDFPLFGTWKFKGSFKEFEFNGALMEVNPSYTSGSLKVLLDGEDRNITSFDLKLYRHSLQPDSLTLQVLGKSLNKTYESGAYLHHELSGPAVCPAIQEVYDYSESTHSQGGIVQYSLYGFNCMENSLMNLKFGILW